MSDLIDKLSQLSINENVEGNLLRRSPRRRGQKQQQQPLQRRIMNTINSNSNVSSSSSTSLASKNSRRSQSAAQPLAPSSSSSSSSPSSSSSSMLMMLKSPVKQRRLNFLTSKLDNSESVEEFKAKKKATAVEGVVGDATVMCNQQQQQDNGYIRFSLCALKLFGKFYNNCSIEVEITSSELIIQFDSNTSNVGSVGDAAIVEPKTPPPPPSPPRVKLSLHRLGDISRTHGGKRLMMSLMHSCNGEEAPMNTITMDLIDVASIEEVWAALRRHELLSPRVQRCISSTYAVKEVIGRGAHAVVRRAISRAAIDVDGGKSVAVKIIDKWAVLEQGSSLLARLRDEYTRAKSIAPHENIIAVYEHFETPRRIFIVMEYAAGGTLAEFVEQHGALGVETTRRLTRQLFCALEHLHAMSLAHRDVKLENLVLVNDAYNEQDGVDRLHVKLIDFGLSKVIYEQRRHDDSAAAATRTPTTATTTNNASIPQGLTYVGTLDYCAPEIVKLRSEPDRNQRQPYTYACDVWSAACIVYACWLGSLPFASSPASRASSSSSSTMGADSRESVFDRILNANYWLPPRSLDSWHVHDFLLHTLVVDPTQRLTAAQALKHEFFAANSNMLLEIISNSSQ